ncbi:hypothetical protein GCM10029963_62070 [Micromonospora andamanensis]|uniref:hypothetical protein n=1 Tax=Micromonospora andamanensis TaxID=1287068 RepID=UPI00194EF961|nr:hypothetical protein [Micromonospora andamanensis]GIJ41611.1 hypothetical protein Vwe01_49360 [Micromonospora andamanensis]
MSGEPEPGLQPEWLRPDHDQGDPVLVTVNGQDFRVQARAGAPGTYDFDWLSGPHDYGFGLSRSDGSVMSRAEMVEAIREFLAEIDPATGYLAE